MDNRVCDFCGSENVMWQYPTGHTPEPIRHNGMMFQDTGRDWVACDFCSAIIETEDRMGLEERSMKAWKIGVGSINKLPGDILELYMKTVIGGVHKMFWEGVNGNRYLINGGQ